MLEKFATLLRRVFHEIFSPDNKDEGNGFEFCLG